MANCCEDVSDEERRRFLEEVRDAKRLDFSSYYVRMPVGRKSNVVDEDRLWGEFVRSLMEEGVEFEIELSGEYVEGRKKGVGTITMERLKKGQICLEATIDLHGLNQRQAREKVREFIHRCRKEGMRCVHIIHGRGMGSPDGIPVLKRRLISWLTSSTGIGKYVDGFVTARRCDGGGGALYILLKT